MNQYEIESGSGCIQSHYEQPNPMSTNNSSKPMMYSNKETSQIRNFVSLLASTPTSNYRPGLSMFVQDRNLMKNSCTDSGKSDFSSKSPSPLLGYLCCKKPITMEYN